jgi:hypothetical protein
MQTDNNDGTSLLKVASVKTVAARGILVLSPKKVANHKDK